MDNSAHAPDRSDGPMDPQFSDDLRQLGEAIENLGGDSSYIIRSLCDWFRTMRPVSREGGLSKHQKQFLIESGDFTAEELAAAKSDVDRGSLQLGAAEVFLSNLYDTMSLNEIAGYLGLTEEAVRIAVSEGRLYAVEISGRLRFPSWQLDVGSPAKLLPGLAGLIKVFAPRWQFHSIAAFMATPQEDLVAEGRKTPGAWLRDGGDLNEVISIVESDDWW